ncbi:nucleoside hydrolase [Nesterenkonia sp. F]|uniref:nucleoside hydrolase n=1 Tax=Nesterenkonia sp. F TaxID=795955 RepID=UPI000681DA7D|nr:nucleoside hydrolase [Nesterenkonia sp. F]
MPTETTDAAAETTDIILDCDPGHDDVVALLLALGSPEIRVLSVTTVAGNQTLEKVTANALATLALAGAEDVDVHAGCQRPLTRELQVAADIHGESGLDGVTLPAPSRAARAEHAVDRIIAEVMDRPASTVTLVPTGPLTNIAAAVRREPRIVERVREVVLMGGACRGGNVTPAAEFNIHVDPEAADVVFDQDWPLTMVGLDATHQAVADEQIVAACAELGTDVGAAMADLLGAFGRNYRAAQGFAAAPLHDACTIAELVEPGLLQTVTAPVAVELHGEHTTGMTVADLRPQAPSGGTTRVALGLDRDRFWAILLDALARL